MSNEKVSKRKQAFEIFKEHKGNIDLVEIARLLESPSGTVRGWKSKDKWDEQLGGTFQTKKRNAPKRKKGGQPGNQNAKSHGLHAKWLPSETNDIFNELINSDPADILWNNIMIQYTAIIRAQKIMFVTDKEEMIKELKKEKESSGGNSWSEEKEWEFQFSWDRHANFLNAQTRAMGTLGNLIKQFISIADEADERRLKLELMQGQIDKLKGPQKNTSDTDWKEALKEAEAGKFGEIEDER